MAKHSAAPSRAQNHAVRRAVAIAAVAVTGFGIAAPAAHAAGVKNVRPQFAAAQSASVSKGQHVVNIARQYKGVPYRWGGTTPAGFDCSGFTQFVYRKAGKNLPRTSSQQSKVGKRVPASQARPGDLVWKPGHIGIYTGGGKMIHSPRPGKRVQEVKVYSKSFVYIRVV